MHGAAIGSATATGAGEQGKEKHIFKSRRGKRKRRTKQILVTIHFKEERAINVNEPYFVGVNNTKSLSITRDDKYRARHHPYSALIPLNPFYSIY